MSPKPPLALVSRCRTIPSSPTRRAPMSTTQTAPKDNQSKVLAALASMSLSELGDTRNNLVETTKSTSIHPFFHAAATPAVLPRRPAAAKNGLTSATKTSLVRLTPAEEPAETQTPIEQDIPLYSYKALKPSPKMRFTRDEAQADEWVQELDLSSAISVDFEWVVPFRKGVHRPISLVQLADKKNIIVVQLLTSSSSMKRFPLNLQRLLENPDIPKMGANILNDAKRAFRDYGVMMVNAVELGALARHADPSCTDPKIWGQGKKIVALAKLVERYLQKKLSKDADVRLSNWEDPKLDERPDMLEYASNDAYCGLQVYDHLMGLVKSNDVTLDPTKFTSGVHYGCLKSPSPPTPLVDPKEPVPVIYYTAEMDNAGVRPQALRAYRYWHLGKRDIDTMCRELLIKRTPDMDALARGTVVSYVMETLTRLVPTPEYDLGALRLLIQTDLRSWERHHTWIGKVGCIEALLDVKK
ncbi:ribonuclease H-like domain-containing protein [Mycena sp. CBHHK59/15]|nr:ribonuclease H-like domain-containing protein [Mycena sp. CBHHK59/15]